MRSASLLLGVVVAAATFAAAAACGHDDNDPINPATPDASVATDGGADAKPSGLCVDGKSRDGDYPAGPTSITIAKTIPNLAFDGTDADGTTPRSFSLSSWFEPCAARSRLLVLRVGAAWCGTCNWHLGNTKLFATPELAPRLALVDVVIGDEDNRPAEVGDLARVRPRVDVPAERYAADPKHRLRAIDAGQVQLPLYVLVDTRTMVIRNYLNDPSPEVFENTVRDELALIDGAARPAPKPEALFDGVFNREMRDMLSAMTLPAAPPPDPTNEVADSAAAAALGKQLFFDKQLSPSGNFACSTCHDKDKLFADGVPQSTGVSKVDRNSPTVALAAHQRWQFWDGRADTLWMQALGPFEDPKEIGSTRLFVAHQIESRYKAAYDAVFTKYPLPDISDTARFPPQGKPGTPVYDAMSPADKDAINRVYVNVGKAIAAYERALRVQPNALDRYNGGDLAALNAAQKEGAQLFFRAGCAQCHFGPRLTNDAFHVVRFPTGRQDGVADRGRVDAVAKLLASEFNSRSKWSDKPEAGDRILRAYDGPSMLGAFKTPTLRGLDRSGPFGHGGTLATLLEVTETYGKGGLDAADPRTTGALESWLTRFDPHAQQAIVPFLSALSGEVISP